MTAPWPGPVPPGGPDGSGHPHQTGEHLSLLITDPFHPVTAPTMTALRRGCDECRIIGVDTAAGTQPSPPGLDAVVRVPSAEHPGYAEAVAVTAARHQVTAVLPWTDRDARALSVFAPQLRVTGAALVCPPTSLVELAGDKWATVSRLTELGIPSPESRLVRSGATLATAARELDHPAWDLFLKPRDLAGGRGVWRIRADANPMATGSWPCVPLPAMASILGESPRGDFVVQQEMRGLDVSVDLLAQDGRLLAAVARTRQATLGGLSVAGEVTALPERIREVVEDLTLGLGWTGLANVQMIVSPSGDMSIYEINGRAAGSLALGIYAGTDLLSAAIHLARTGLPPLGLGDPWQVAVEPVAFRRYWLDQCWPVADPLLAPRQHVR